MTNETVSEHEGLPGGRVAGVCLHVTSLPGNFGIGDIGDKAFEFIDLLKGMGITVWQVLPTGPTAYGDSPYQPLSSFAGNEMLIDVAGLIRMGLISSLEAESLWDLPRDYVDYGELIPRKRRLLERAAGHFQVTADETMKARYQAFLDRNDGPWLHDYALFRILKAMHDERPWAEWDAPYARRDAEALARVARDRADELERVKITQFLFDCQWRRLREHAAHQGICLFGDIPIYIALDSADAWAHPEILRMDPEGNPTHVAGVPPDYFSEDGQLWGNPLYDWAYHDASGYAWWIERLRHVSRLVDVVRIDHFRGFEAYWEVPFGAETAREGRWVPGPGDRIFDAVREALGHLPIVAEDLGVITPEVEGLRDRHGLPGMVVLQFTLGAPEFDPAGIRRNSVCYTGTHDNDTTLGWFLGSPGDQRSREEIERTQAVVLARTGGSAQTVARDILRIALESDARMAIAPMQDYLGLGSEARMNRPGTSANNWRWRLTDEQLSAELIEGVRALVEASGRMSAGGAPAA